MAQDPRGAWAAMPRPHPRPRRRPPPGTGKAQQLGSPASSKTLWRGMDACAPNSSSERCPEVLALRPLSPAGLPGSAPTVCSVVFTVPAATCHQNASPRCAAKTPAAAPRPLAATVAPKRKGECRGRGQVTDCGAKTSDRHRKGWGI